MTAGAGTRAADHEDFERCEYGHKCCSQCGSCSCEGGGRAVTDKHGWLLCASCREMARNDGGLSVTGLGIYRACSFDALARY